MTPDITVLVTTCDRPDKLRRILTDLGRQTLAPERFEVLVSDDGSVVPAEEACADLRLESALRFVRGPRRGPATARNRVLPLVQAPLLLFLNDDLWLEPELLEAHLHAHSLCPEPTAVMGTFEFTPEVRRHAIN